MTRLETLAQVSSLKTAWAALKRNKQSYGIDEVRISNFAANLDANLLDISNQLKAGTYKFSPVRGVALPKPGSHKKRPIRIATVSDRVVQKAIELSIAKELTDAFGVNNKASYAYIKEKGLLKAVGRINELVGSGYDICLKGDIQNYFGEVNTRKLLDEMVFPALGADRSLNSLIEESLSQEVGNIRYLRKRLGTKEAEQIFPKVPMGIPQGGILSPLFSNIYLRDLDHALLNKGFELVRYADDFIVLTKTLEEALDAYEIALNVTKGLGLKLHTLSSKNVIKDKKARTKTYLTSTSDFEFLGIAFYKGQLYPSDGAFKKMRAKLSDLRKSSALNVNSLGQKLYGVEQLINSWAQTYWFTSVDNHVKDRYISLNTSLNKTVIAIIGSNGLAFKSVALSDKKKLKKLGLSMFQYRLQSVKQKTVSSKSKVELVKIFIPGHKL